MAITQLGFFGNEVVIQKNPETKQIQTSSKKGVNEQDEYDFSVHIYNSRRYDTEGQVSSYIILLTEGAKEATENFDRLRHGPEVRTIDYNTTYRVVSDLLEANLSGKVRTPQETLEINPDNFSDILRSCYTEE